MSLNFAQNARHKVTVTRIILPPSRPLLLRRLRFPCCDLQDCDVRRPRSYSWLGVSAEHNHRCSRRCVEGLFFFSMGSSVLVCVCLCLRSTTTVYRSALFPTLNLKALLASIVCAYSVISLDAPVTIVVPVDLPFIPVGPTKSICSLKRCPI